MDRLISEDKVIRAIYAEHDRAGTLRGYLDAIKAIPSAELCDDAISRQAVDEIKELMTDINGDTVYAVRMSDIRQLPSVNPQAKTGHWVKTPKAVMGEGYMWYCDKCEHQVYQDSSRLYPSQKYCPNCGCRMILPFV